MASEAGKKPFQRLPVIPEGLREEMSLRTSSSLEAQTSRKASPGKPKSASQLLVLISLIVMMVMASLWFLVTGYAQNESRQALENNPDDVLLIVGGQAYPSVEVLSLNGEPIKCREPPKKLTVPIHSIKWPMIYKHKGDTIFCLGKNESPCLKYSQKRNKWERFHQLSVKRSEKLELQQPGLDDVAGDLPSTLGHNSPSSFWNPRTHRLVCRPELPYLSEGHCIVPIDNVRDILTGGFNSEQGYMNSTFMYNRRTCQWTRLADMKQKRRYHSCGLVDQSKVVVLGGYHGIHSAPYLSFAEVYDLKTKKWSRRPNFPLLLYGTASPQLNGTFIAMGGKKASVPDPGHLYQELKSLFQAEGSKPSWEKKSPEGNSDRFKKPAFYKLPRTYFSCVLDDKEQGN